MFQIEDDLGWRSEVGKIRSDASREENTEITVTFLQAIVFYFRHLLPEMKPLKLYNIK
jgi:hypothetical protein